MIDPTTATDTAAVDAMIDVLRLIRPIAFIVPSSGSADAARLPIR
ncbi:hypothetical protein [Microbacterium natoriense]|nr:hypothetical protein [Microbacterium natoriense]